MGKRVKSKSVAPRARRDCTALSGQPAHSTWLFPVLLTLIFFINHLLKPPMPNLETRASRHLQQSPSSMKIALLKTIGKNCRDWDSDSIHSSAINFHSKTEKGNLCLSNQCITEKQCSFSPKDTFYWFAELGSEVTDTQDNLEAFCRIWTSSWDEEWKKH